MELIELARREGRPKAVYGEAFIEARDGDTVRVGAVTFTSRVLARNTQSAERVFPFVATCGREMDEIFPDPGDMLKGFWWEAIKTCLLGAADSQVRERIGAAYRLGKTAIMRPGSGDAQVWPLEQQRGLFALLGDVECRIGVALTDSFLMVPNKTTSGVLFPTEKDFRSCEVCHREACPSRQAAFNSALWEEFQHA